MRKRLLSFALAVVLCLSMFSLSAFAAASETVDAQYISGMVTYADGTSTSSTASYAIGNNYFIRLLSEDASYLLAMLTVTADASGINGSINVGSLANASYPVYVDDESGTTVAKGTLVVNVTAPTTYTLTVQYGTGGTASGGGSKTTNSFDITASPNSNYKFDKWTIISGNGIFGNASNASTTFTITSGTTATVNANFTDTGGGGGGGGGSSGGGGGGSTASNLTITSSPNGKITASPSNPSKGDKVTLTVTPNSGYELDTLTIKDKNGNLVSYTDNGNGTFTYTQPDGKVTITATFKRIQEAGPVEPAKPTGLSFTDVSGHWAYDNICVVVERGLFSGTSATTFSPNTSMTRAMFATVLSRLEGADTSGYTSSRFGDVPSGTWYTGGVEWAAENGVVSGVGSDLFDPNANITREQMAAMLYRYLQYKGYELPVLNSGGEFDDAGRISLWAGEAVEYMQRAGIISGKPGNVFDPKGIATRAEVATVFAKFIEALEG